MSFHIQKKKINENLTVTDTYTRNSCIIMYFNTNKKVIYDFQVESWVVPKQSNKKVVKYVGDTVELVEPDKLDIEEYLRVAREYLIRGIMNNKYTSESD